MPVNGHQLGPDTARTGWGWLVVETASRAYLSLVLALLVIAVGPSLITDWQGHVIRSGSMEPHISAGDVVLTSTLPDSSPVPVGRVVVFRSLGSAVAGGPLNAAAAETILVMHRIVATNEDGGYVTAGDANVDVDSTPLVREKITGQGRLLVPWVGLPSRWIDTGAFLQLAGWLALTGTAIAVLALSPAAQPRRAPQKRNGPGAGLTSAASPTATASPSGWSPASRPATGLLTHT